jgi:hypothetical protein
MQMNPVFSYFFAIGSGLALGIAVVTVPVMALYPRIAARIGKRKKG